MSGVCTAAEIKSWSRQLPNCLCLCVVMQTDNDVTVTSREFPRHFRHVTTRTDNFFLYVVMLLGLLNELQIMTHRDLCIAFTSWTMLTLVNCPCVLTNRRSGGGFNRGFRVRDSSVMTCVQERVALTYFYRKRKVLANEPSTAPLEV